MILGGGSLPSSVTKWPIKTIGFRVGVYLVCNTHQQLNKMLNTECSERSPDGSRCLVTSVKESGLE